ncbi:MAG: Ribonuclease Z [Burkholderiaceae bacterium]|jgi:ribonuclease Z|nr:MAG: Ribonuclease Z [Burkholderiaceae bacterium]
MKKLIQKALGLVVCTLALQQAIAAPLNVTLLGTGSPVPSSVRFSQAILIEAGKEKILVDAGRGVTIRLSQLGIPLRELTSIFLTHLHSDHIDGLQDLWSTGWLPTPWGSRTQPLSIYGPEGTEAMTKNLSAAFNWDIKTREADEKLPPSGIAWDAHDIGPGVAYDRNGVKITAFPTHHGDLIKPNFGYAIEYDGKKVVISGDTTYDERIAREAKGADLLIHEVADIDPDLLKNFPRLKEVEAHHTSPEEAGRIFSMARPKLAAFTHIIVARANAPLDLAPTEVRARTRKTYSGPLVIGEDLMRFEIDGGEVKVFDARRKPVSMTE